MNKEKKKQIAFIEDCYRLYENKMYYVAYGILHDEGLAEDAVQDAFLKLMKHEVQFDSVESDDCKRYIITVIRNAAINIYNKKKRESEHMYLTDDDTKYDSTVEMDPDSDAGWQEIMKGLPEKYYEVVYYLVIKDYSTRETARKLNLSDRKRWLQYNSNQP